MTCKAKPSIQGTAADIAKNAVLTTQRRLETKELGARIILLIHDEIVWEVKVAKTISAD